MAKNKKRMTKKKKMKILLVVEFLLLILVIAGVILVTFGKGMLDKVQRQEVNEKNIGINEGLSEKVGEGYTNIAVFGVDSRQNKLDKALSDMIMIVSINNKTKEVKVVSVYRDTLLLFDADKKDFQKATHAYSLGGAELALKVLNSNFDLNITDYITVNFEAVYQAVDAVGGVDIEIDKREQGDINRYIEELNKINKTNSPYIYDTGVLHLDGIQATAYGRLREIDSDYARTDRQREVMMELFNKVKGSSAGTLKNLVNQLAPKVLTSLSNKEILDLVLDVSSYDIVDQTGFPFEHGGKNIGGKNGWVVTIDNLKLSVKQLHAYLFDEKDYEPSAQVNAISEALDKKLERKENTKTTMYSSSTGKGDSEEESNTKAGAKTSNTRKSRE